jgi:membrane associated rhomboid family serine protease
MNDQAREPIFNLPRVVLALLALLAVIHIVRVLLPPEDDLRLVASFAFVPGRFGLLINQSGIIEELARLARQSSDDAQLGRFFLAYGSPRDLWLTPLSYSFLHGDWTHLIFNSVWLAAFGSPPARRFGPVRFLLLGVLGAVAGAAAHLATHLYDLAPVVGASAAVSAYMGASARFVFAPGMRLGDPLAGAGTRLARLSELPGNTQALAFVGFWFASNLLVGLGGQGLGFSQAPIAWEAHIGGFLLGLLAAPLFDQRRKA